MTTKRGYDVDSGFMGWIESTNEWKLFASYRDYVEFVEEGSR